MQSILHEMVYENLDRITDSIVKEILDEVVEMVFAEVSKRGTDADINSIKEAILLKMQKCKPVCQ
jgi:hypothetical protein